MWFYCKVALNSHLSYCVLNDNKTTKSTDNAYKKMKRTLRTFNAEPIFYLLISEIIYPEWAAVKSTIILYIKNLWALSRPTALQTLCIKH